MTIEQDDEMGKTYMVFSGIIQRVDFGDYQKSKITFICYHFRKHLRACTIKLSTVCNVKTTSLYIYIRSTCRENVE